MIDSLVVDGAALVQSSPPIWALWFAFIASLLLTLVTLGVTVARVVRKAALEVRATRDTEMRWLVFQGECFYANLVLLTRDGSALVKKAKGRLIKRREGAASKEYDLSLVLAGDKDKGPNLEANFWFHASTPVEFLGPDSSTRRTYVFVVDEYQDAIKKLWENFSAEFAAKGDELGPDYPDRAEENEAQQLGLAVSARAMDYANEAMEYLQVEEGWYRLEVDVTYEARRLWRNESRTVTTGVDMRFGSACRAELRQKIATVLIKTAGALMFPGRYDQDIGTVGLLPVESVDEE